MDIILRPACLSDSILNQLMLPRLNAYVKEKLPSLLESKGSSPDPESCVEWLKTSLTSSFFDHLEFKPLSTTARFNSELMDIWREINFVAYGTVVYGGKFQKLPGMTMECMRPFVARGSFTWSDSSISTPKESELVKVRDFVAAAILDFSMDFV